MAARKSTATASPCTTKPTTSVPRRMTSTTPKPVEGKATATPLAAQTDRHPRPNPLAQELRARHETTLDRLRDLLGDSFDVMGCEGFVSEFPESNGCRTATDDEAARIEVECFERTFFVDGRSDIGPQALAHLRTFIRELQSTANRLETEMQRGKIPGLPRKAVK